MSASPMARQITESKAIPIRRVALNDPSELPHDYSSTPGGTLYSTTPGGTRIVYERTFLMNLRSSPISKTPPKWDIPESLQRGTKSSPPKPKMTPKRNNIIKRNNHVDENQDQFEMDM